jgi:hypothetical protein
VAKPYYKDLRDVNKFVGRLLSSPTYVARQADTLLVEFPPQRSKNIRAALEALCDFLNSRPPVDLNLSFTKITFRVGEKH